MNLSQLISFARRHHQLVSREVAAELGMSKSAWYWALDSGRLEPLYPGVARIAGAVSTPEQQILAAVWACGHGTRASHRSAAHLWCPEDPPAVVDLIVPRRTRGISAPGVVVHRPKDLDDLRISYRGNIPTTNPLRVLLDLGAVDRSAVRPFLERAVIAGLVTPGAVSAALVRHRRQGRHGVVVLEEVLDDWTMNDKPPDSVLEEAMSALAVRYGLPPLTFHPVLLGYEVDFQVTGTQIVVECDGWATHGLLRDTFERDRDRDGDLTAAGYAVVRVTWRMIRHRPAVVAQRIRTVVGRLAPHLLQDQGTRSA